MVAWIGAGVLLIILLLLWLVPQYGLNQITRMKKSTYEMCLNILEQCNIFSKQQFDDCKKEQVYVYSRDGLKLHGYYVEKYPHSKRTIVIVHGYTSALTWSAQFMDMFFRQGFNVLLVDQRRHGQSEGEYTTYGYYEKYDIQAWVDWIIARKGEQAVIGLHGQSLGGGTVLEYVSIHSPQVRFVIADCPYSDLTTLLKYQISKLNHMPTWPFLKLIDRLLHRKAGFRMQDVSPERAIAESDLPIMFVHGAADKYVPTYMSERMYDIKQGPKKLLLIEGAEHAVAYCVNKQQYEEAVVEFVVHTIGKPTEEEWSEASPVYSTEAQVQTEAGAFAVGQDPAPIS
ncbi:alpha/beta hydrolase [Paenibacillus sp. 481]|uniref:alpha/beta hydrolase n=1 Tax=Paenibacillus sp. 481 TaxID=2835869 RepID=UPI001E3302F2|nr:alpha/beta hydrolase [Paenibacillus sp. 481]UHA74944.1 alpha/beta hydrolase [Paenibacillus sp. 481]